LLRNQHYQTEVEHRIKFCIKRHIEIINAASNALTKFRKWIPIFAIVVIPFFLS
ncbi:unnamed protein product, partial [Tenebrio molitor]